MNGVVRAVSRSTRSLTFGLAVLAGPAWAQQPAPIADFFKPPEFSELVMSPSGKYIAALVAGPDGRTRLAVLDTADLLKSRIIASAKGSDIDGAYWVNDERLVFSVYDALDALAGNRYAALLAANADGSDSARVLVRPVWNTFTTGTNIVDRALAPNHRLRGLVRDGTADVIVQEYVFSQIGEVDHVNLKRVDTLTGRALSMTQGAPTGVQGWALDSSGKPRALIATDGAKEALYWRAKPDAEWTKVQEVDRSQGDTTAQPIYVDASDRLFASARVGGKEDTASAIVVGMRVGLEKAQPILSAPGYDIAPQIISNGRGTVLGLRYLTDARATHWFDPDMQKLQAQVDALLPGLINLLDCGSCDRRDKVLVSSYSDRRSPSFRLFDTKTASLTPIADSRPWIKPAAMAQRDLFRVPARDGLSMPVHVTRPLGSKGPQPMVVMVHGGPFVRGGEWEWEAKSQFLASRGYVVVEPEFRGSTGFGDKHFRAGWKQWGLAMQDDIADAAQWAVKQGYADPKRICIAGASYGGYATLMGLIRNPELFRCGVEWVGVTDIDLIYSTTWSDTDNDFLKYGMPVLVGDRVKDAAQLAATSPIRLAEKVTQPLLMAYGGLDRRVPIIHGTEFRDAVRKTNKQVEWIGYADEGHGWSTLEHHVDFWSRVEKFLDKNLKNAN